MSHLKPSERFKLVCAGGGPAGISLAIEAIELGMDPKEIVVLEKGEHSIQAIRTFYPDKKMTLANYKNLPVETFGVLQSFPDLTKQETIEYFDALIQKYQLRYLLRSEVSKVLPSPEGLKVLVNQTEILADHVAIGIGILGRPNKPSYKIPVKLRKEVLFDLTSVPIKNEKVLVVGGGDSSSEYCQILVDENCEVTLAYRSIEFTKMMDSNREEALRLESEKRLRILRSCEISEIQEHEGKPKVLFQDDKKFPTEVFDKVVFAIGGTTPVNFLKSIGLEFDADNWVKIGPDGETTVPGVYVIGDLAVSKTGGSIITAYNSSYRTARRILQGERS
jgi:thioredoxin reductase (NADPH)